jgi:hypothetical protein
MGVNMIRNLNAILALFFLGLSSSWASAATWTNTPLLAAQSGSIVAVVDAIPTQSGSGEDVVIGFSNGPASQWNDLAAIARFNSAGTIDVRNGNNYSSLANVTYSAGLRYQFRFEINIPARTYTIYVEQGATRTLLAKDFSFRSEQANQSQLNNFAKGVAYGGATISDLRLIRSTPTMAASAISASQINLSWNGAVAPTGYMVQSYSVQRDGIEIAKVAGASYNNTSLVASMTYAYRVAAILSIGDGSALSNVVSKTTLAAPTPTPIPMPLQSSNGAPVPDVTRFSGIDGSLINLDNHPFEVQTLQPYSLQNPDSQTLRFELRSGDIYGNYGGTERVELEQQIYVNGTWGYPADTDLHVAYDFMLEPGNPNTSQWVVIGQWHHGDAGSPPFAVALRGEYMRIITRTADTNAEVNMYTDPKPIQRGHYYSMDIWVNFARGTLNVVRDGVPIVSFSGQGKLGTGTSRYYWKHGIYRAPTTNDTQVARYRNFIISP